MSKKRNVKISFLMIAYNTEKYVEYAIRSILNQTIREVNVIVRNNGSTDKTGEILRKIAKSDSRVYVLENEKNWFIDDETHFCSDGVFKIWNIENKDILGEYISIVDSDDWIAQNFAEIMYKEATAVNADLTVCGHSFMADINKNTGNRVPPSISTSDSKTMCDIVRNNFMEFYNVHRAWWAKLFRTEFFYEHYNCAWALLSNCIYLDTVHMLRYSVKAKSYAAVNKTLYFQRIHAESSYIGKARDFRRALQAEKLYAAGIELLDVFDAHTPENDAFIMALHWAFLRETLECLNNPYEGFSPKLDLSWLAFMLGNSVLAGLPVADMSEAWNTAKKYINIILQRNGSDLFVYSSYLPRLLYVELLISAGSKLAFPILIGCLYDVENKNLLGKQLLTHVALSNEYNPVVKAKIHQLLWKAQTTIKHPFYDTSLISANAEKVYETEQKLAIAMDKGDYETACDLLEELLIFNPLSRDAIYYRIKISVLIEDSELAAVLAGTAISLWPADIEMQCLCWDIFNKYTGKENVE